MLLDVHLSIRRRHKHSMQFPSRVVKQKERRPRFDALYVAEMRRRESKDAPVHALVVGVVRTSEDHAS